MSSKVIARFCRTSIVYVRCISQNSIISIQKWYSRLKKWEWRCSTLQGAKKCLLVRHLNPRCYDDLTADTQWQIKGDLFHGLPEIAAAHVQGREQGVLLSKVTSSRWIFGKNLGAASPGVKIFVFDKGISTTVGIFRVQWHPFAPAPFPPSPLSSLLKVPQQFSWQP